MKKSLKSNYIYNLSYQILVMFLPLIVTPYLSRVLGAEKIGIHGFTISILSYFVLFGSLGINTYGQREIAFYQTDKEKRSKIFWELFLLKTIMILISSIFFIVICYGNSKYGIYYKILTIELISNIFDITWLYQGMEDFKKITIRNAVIRIVSLIATFLFVKSPTDLIIYFFIYSVSNLFGYLILWAKLKNYVSSIKLKALNVFKHLKPTISLFIPQIAIQVYTVLDKTMLGILLDDISEVGYYDQSQKIVKMCLMIVTALGTVMVPRIANLFATGNFKELNLKIIKAFKIVSFCAFPICFGLIAISLNFVPWFFGDGYLPVITLLSIFSFLILGIGFNNITGVQYLISTKKQNIFTKSVILGAIINFVLNLLFIPIFKGNGAALSTVMAEFCIFAFQVVYLKNTFDFKQIFKDNMKYLFMSLVMCVIVYLVGTVMNPTILTTFIQVIIGGIVYLILLHVTKDSVLKEVLSMVKKILKRGNANEK